MGDPFFVKRFRQAERPGVYCRVVREGMLRAGEPVEIRRYDGVKVPALEVFRDFFDLEPDEEAIRRQLAAPIAVRARAIKEKQLGELLARKNQQAKRSVSAERT